MCLKNILRLSLSIISVNVKSFSLLPYDVRNINFVFQNSLKFPEEASEVSELLISLIKGLLQEASSRLGYDKLIVHPFFTDIDWNNIQHSKFIIYGLSILNSKILKILK